MRTLAAFALLAALAKGQHFRPQVPKTWDESALKDWATPLAGLNARPTHMTARSVHPFLRLQPAISNGLDCSDPCCPVLFPGALRPHSLRPFPPRVVLGWHPAVLVGHWSGSHHRPKRAVASIRGIVNQIARMQYLVAGTPTSFLMDTQLLGDSRLHRPERGAARRAEHDADCLRFSPTTIATGTVSAAAFMSTPRYLEPRREPRGPRGYGRNKD